MLQVDYTTGSVLISEILMYVDVQWCKIWPLR